MRIARELHDVIAHSMAMINVQASAAAMLLADEPERAADAIQAIRGASKAGLRELRAILNVLRQADTDLPGRPSPTCATIRALAEATTAAGTPTSVEADELAAPLPPPVALAAYRIVQESLTNVVRHAGRGTAAVTVRQDGSDLLVEVVNDGAPAAAAFRRRYRYRAGGDARAGGGPRGYPGGRAPGRGRLRGPGQAPDDARGHRGRTTASRRSRSRAGAGGKPAARPMAGPP